jgi:hypothetical protein
MKEKKGRKTERSKNESSKREMISERKRSKDRKTQEAQNQHFITELNLDSVPSIRLYSGSHEELVCDYHSAQKQ